MSMIRPIFGVAAPWLLASILAAQPETGTPPAEGGKASEAAASAAGDKIKAIVSEHFCNVAIIEGDAGAGTGFIIKENNVTHLYTAAHVLAGNKRLKVKNANGQQFSKFGTFEVAMDADLARLQLLQDFDSDLRIAKPGSIKVNDPLLAIGNSGGAGVLTVLEGKVVSLGPDIIEVSNGVIQGNSGGPVFSGISGEVTGVVTHLIAGRDDIWAKDTGFSEIRRFAARLDRDIKWQEMPILRFLSEAASIQEFNRNTRILFALSMLDPTQAGLRLDTKVSKDGPTLLSIFEENKEVPAVAELIAMNTQLGDKRLRTSESDLRSRFSNYYNSAVGKLNRDGGKFVPASYSGHNRKQVEQARQWRDEALKQIKSATARLR